MSKKHILLTLLQVTAIFGAVSIWAAPYKNPFYRKPLKPVVTEKAFHEVTPQIIQDIKETMSKYLVHRFFTKVTGVPVELYGAPIVTREWLMEQAPKDLDAQAVLDAIAKSLAAKKFSVENIKVYKGESFSFSPPYAKATLKIDNRQWPIEYLVFQGNGNKYEVKIQGLRRMKFRPLPLSQQKIAPLPYAKVDIAKIRQLNEEFFAVNDLPRGEFESIIEFNARKRKEKAKAYKKFKSSNIAGNVYEFEYVMKNPEELEYILKRKYIAYDSLARATEPLKRKIPFLSTSSLGLQSADIDFAGVLKTSERNAFGSTRYCTVNEAKLIKKNLGNTWKYSRLKLWLKFDLPHLEWCIIKVFILPEK